MELKDYTTEEIRAELKRRNAEAAHKRAMERKAMGTQYAYELAEVTYMSPGAFYFRTYDVRMLNKERFSGYRERQSYVGLVRAFFNTSNAPRVGDIVKLRSRKTKDNPDGFGLFENAKICEVVKRKED